MSSAFNYACNLITESLHLSMQSKTVGGERDYSSFMTLIGGSGRFAAASCSRARSRFEHCGSDEYEVDIREVKLLVL